MAIIADVPLKDSNLTGAYLYITEAKVVQSYATVWDENADDGEGGTGADVFQKSTFLVYEVAVHSSEAARDAEEVKKTAPEVDRFKVADYAGTNPLVDACADLKTRSALTNAVNA